MKSASLLPKTFRKRTGIEEIKTVETLKPNQIIRKNY